MASASTLSAMFTRRRGLAKHSAMSARTSPRQGPDRTSACPCRQASSPSSFSPSQRSRTSKKPTTTSTWHCCSRLSTRLTRSSRSRQDTSARPWVEIARVLRPRASCGCLPSLPPTTPRPKDRGPPRTLTPTASRGRSKSLSSCERPLKELRRPGGSHCESRTVTAQSSRPWRSPRATAISWPTTASPRRGSLGANLSIVMTRRSRASGLACERRC
mmetsp:Transcript_47313/g.109486  ORF Transcript_47313/g.109486 Transcript_47313/m.109486 type:complete len:216 (-) Transcript_47313:316-963(-)